MAFLDFLVEQELNELVVRGNRSTKDKIKKKRLNRMKRLKKCSGNLTPSVTTVNGVQKVTCTPKDRTLYFDRKNYFYPDLPKGYQITQQFHPIGTKGYVEIVSEGEKIRVGVDNAHLEEDTAKQIHLSNISLLNFNRCGTPLIEIVSDPDMRSGDQAMKYVEAIREIVTYLGVSDGKMENGSLRCDNTTANSSS